MSGVPQVPYCAEVQYVVEPVAHTIETKEWSEDRTVGLRLSTSPPDVAEGWERVTKSDCREVD